MTQLGTHTVGFVLKSEIKKLEQYQYGLYRWYNIKVYKKS